MTMTEQDYKALARIAQSQDGQRLLAILKAEREECRDQLERLPDPVQLHRRQGSADTLKDIIEKLTEARKVVDRRYSE